MLKHKSICLPVLEHDRALVCALLEHANVQRQLLPRITNKLKAEIPDPPNTERGILTLKGLYFQPLFHMIVWNMNKD